MNTSPASSPNSNPGDFLSSSTSPVPVDAQTEGMSEYTKDVLTHFYGSLGIVCFLVGVSLNALVLGFFYSRKESWSNMMYCVIVAVDFFVSLLILPWIFPHFADRQGVWFKSIWFCKTWTVLWGTVSKTTVMLVAMLGMYRMLALLFPLNPFVKSISKKATLAVIGCYAALALLMETTPMWYTSTWYFDWFRMRCEWHGGNAHVRTLLYIWNTVTLAIPVLPILLSSLLSIYGVRKNSADKSWNRASTTIVLFALLYVTLNIPTLVYWGFMTHHWIGGYTSSLMKFDHPGYFYSNFVEILVSLSYFVG